MDRPGGLLVLTADDELLDRLLAVCAAAGCEPTVSPDPATARSLWLGASMIIVGADLAAVVVSAGLPRRGELYLIGLADDGPALALASAPLGAAVVVLPESAGWLATAISEATSAATGSGRLLAVLGGSGGVGASTLAVATAEVSVRGGRSTMLVDADPYGGGIDLLLGAEAFEGWRWPRLAAAHGRLGDLKAQLPVVDRITVLSHAREDTATVGAEAAQSVLGSARRNHQVVIVDLGRPLDPAGRALIVGCDLLVLVVAASIRPVAAARRILDDVVDLGGAPSPTLVVRSSRGSAIDPRSVGQSLGLPVAEVVDDDPGLTRSADAGRPVGRSGRSGRHGVTKVAGALLDRLADSRAAA